MHRRILIRSVLIGTLALSPLAASAADFGVGSGAVPGGVRARQEALASDSAAVVSSQKTQAAPNSAAGALAYYKSWLALDSFDPSIVWGKASTRVTRRVSLIQVRNFLCADYSCSAWTGTKRYNYYGKVWAGHWYWDGFYHNYYSQGAHKVVYDGVRYTRTTSVSGYL